MGARDARAVAAKGLASSGVTVGTMKWLAIVLAACGSGGTTGSPSMPTRDAAAPVAPIAPVVPVAPKPAPVAAYPVIAPPGGEITKLAVAPTGDAALTVDSAGEVRLWPSLDGTQPPVAVEVPRTAVLALRRSGAELVAMVGLPGGTLHVRLAASGKRLAVVELPPIDGVVALEAGFATWVGKHVEWIDDAGKVTRASDTDPRPAPIASKITFKGSDLVIPGPEGPRYLGFAFPLSNRDSRVPLAGPGNRWLRLAPDLTAGGELAPVLPKGMVATAIMQVDDRDWLLDVPAGVMLWTEGTPATPAMPGFHVAQVERETKLVLLTKQGKGLEYRLARYVPATRTLEPIAFTAWGDGTPVLAAPSLAGGTTLVLEGAARDTAGVLHGTIRWIRDVAQPSSTTTNWESATAWPMVATRSGQVTLNYEGRRYGAIGPDQRESSLPSEATLSPSGQRYAAIRIEERPNVHLASTLHVTSLAGTKIWESPLPAGAPRWGNALAWADDKHLWITGNGLAALDADTGAVIRAATGFGFELASTPHPVSSLGRPLAVELPSGRDAPLVLAGDTAFQALVRDVAKTSTEQLVWWGPTRLGGKTLRVAQLQGPVDTGAPTWGFVVELGPGRVIAIHAQGWGFPEFQGPFEDVVPWGTQSRSGDGTDRVETSTTTSLVLHTKWIHGSYEMVALAVERDTVLVDNFAWTERENTGNPARRYAETSGGRSYAKTARPTADRFKGHSIKIWVSPPASDAATLAAFLHARE